MARPCSICTHEQRQAIDQALLSGDTFRVLARRFAVSEDALQRHNRDHLPVRLVRAHEAAEQLQSDSLFDRVRWVNRETAEVMSAVKKKRDYDLTLKAITRVEKQIELEVKMLAVLEDSRNVNLIEHPQWVKLRTAIYGALSAYPEAAKAVADAIAQVDHHAAD